MKYTLKCMDDKQSRKGKFGYVVEKTVSNRGQNQAYARPEWV
jgi:hypothetical protein